MSLSTILCSRCKKTRLTDYQVRNHRCLCSDCAINVSHDILNEMDVPVITANRMADSGMIFHSWHEALEIDWQGIRGIGKVGLAHIEAAKARISIYKIYYPCGAYHYVNSECVNDVLKFDRNKNGDIRVCVQSPPGEPGQNPRFGHSRASCSAACPMPGKHRIVENTKTRRYFSEDGELRIGVFVICHGRLFKIDRNGRTDISNSPSPTDEQEGGGSV